MASVSLSGLSKRFPGGGFAVRELDLEIADGEFLCVVGVVDATRRSPRDRDLAIRILFGCPFDVDFLFFR